MTRVAGILSFLPQELIPILMVTGGLLLILGMRGLASSLFGFCGLMIVLPPVLEALLNELPEWTLLPIMAIAMLSMGTFLLSLLLGKEAYAQFIGQIAANVFTWFFLLPFRLIRWLFVGFLGRR